MATNAETSTAAVARRPLFVNARLESLLPEVVMR
jgi:hypothetical protein